jgi:hypothetical protein
VAAAAAVYASKRIMYRRENHHLCASVAGAKLTEKRERLSVFSPNHPKGILIVGHFTLTSDDRFNARFESRVFRGLSVERISSSRKRIASSFARAFI